MLSLVASAVALILVGLVAAATAPASEDSGVQRESQEALPQGMVSIAITSDPGSSIPSRRPGATAQQVAEFKLHEQGARAYQLPGGGKIVSGLAKKWKVLSQTKRRFTLHSGVTCS